MPRSSVSKKTWWLANAIVRRRKGGELNEVNIRPEADFFLPKYSLHDIARVHIAILHRSVWLECN
jgi:hypothetical protein